MRTSFPPIRFYNIIERVHMCGFFFKFLTFRVKVIFTCVLAFELFAGLYQCKAEESMIQQ